MNGLLDFPPDLTEDDLLRSICRESFYDFVREMWHTIIPEKPVWNWHIKYLCDFLQFKILEPVFRWEPYEYDAVINIPPGTSKSTVFSVMLTGWAWTRMPSFRFLGTSYSGLLAKNLGRLTRDLVTSEKYRRLFPEIVIKDDLDAKGNFGNTLGGIRYSVGTGGTVTGFHFHVIGVDDPMDPVKVASAAELANTNYYLTQTLPGRKVDLNIAPTVMVMQRLRQGDPTESLLAASPKCRHISLPAEITRDHHPKPRRLEKYYTDGLLDPVRLNRTALDRAKLRLTEFGYAGQYLQSPLPVGGSVFKTGMLHFAPPPDKFKRIIRVWDKATTKVTNDKLSQKFAYTAGVKMALGTDGRFWILDVVRFQLDSWSREARIRSTAVRDGYQCHVGQEKEPGSGGQMSADYSAKRLRGFTVRTFPATGSKEDRADPFSTQVNAGNVWIAAPSGHCPPAGWQHDYVEEMKYWPFSTHLDQIDASAHAFNYLARPRMVVGGAGF